MNPDETCYKCGGNLKSGHEERTDSDPSTGYRETIYVCSYCLTEEDDEKYDADRDDAADAAYDCEMEN